MELLLDLGVCFGLGLNLGLGLCLDVGLVIDLEVGLGLIGDIDLDETNSTTKMV